MSPADRLLVRAGAHGGPWLAVFTLTALVIAAAETALPIVLGNAVDAMLGSAPRSALSIAAALIVLLVLCDALDDFAGGAAMARSTAWLRRSMVERVLAGGTVGSQDLSSGELASRVGANASDAGRIAHDAVRAVANVIPSVGALVALALIDPWLCLTFVAGVPVLLVFVRAFARDVSFSSSSYLAAQGRIAERLSEALAGARSIAAAGTVRREQDRVLAPLPELHKQGLGMWRAHMRMSAQGALVAPLLQIAVLAVAGVQLSNGRISIGETLAAVQYVALATTLGSAGTSIGRLVRARAAAARAATVFGAPHAPHGEKTLPQGHGRLELQGVTARVGERTVLDQVHLIVPAGCFVALVGRSGSGKSLLAAIIGQLALPDEGAVLLDGVAVSQLDPGELRRAIGYGFERPVLIGDTFAAVIEFGAELPEPIDIAAAARRAHADHFISLMPEGYDTQVASAPISGGEQQRVGLARLFAHAGRLIVLDDVAASLDTITERQISRVLTDELAGCTRVVVAHRASTAARADEVVWLDRGRVRAVAPHDELWAEPEYRSLFADGEGTLERELGVCSALDAETFDRSLT